MGREPAGTPGHYNSILRNLVRRFGPVAATIGVTLLTAALSFGLSTVISVMLRRDPFGGSFWIAIVGPLIIAPFMALPIFRVVDQLDRTEREFQRLSTVDDLTGAFNRRRFFEIGEQEVERARTEKGVFSVAAMDFDGFKNINDRHGHLQGDKTLIAVARACEACIRKGDVMARYGGDEFIFLFPDTGSDAARGLAERVLAAVVKVRVTNGKRAIRPSVSIGLATASRTLRNLDDVLAQADEALYRAKKKGGNQFVQV